MTENGHRVDGARVDGGPGAGPRVLGLVYSPAHDDREAISAVASHLAHPSRCELLPVDGSRVVFESVRDALDRGVERILVAGGDGTIRDALQAFGPEFPAVGFAVLPRGTGNDFSRALGIHHDLELAVEVALNGPTVKADVVDLEVDGEDRGWFLNVANGGFGGRVADRLERRAKKRWGPFAYWMSTLGTMTEEQPRFEIELTLDGEEPHREAVSAIAIANGRYLGGGFPVARHARIDDGMLDVTLAPPLETHEFLAAGMDFAFGRESENPLVRTHRARRVEIRAHPPMPFSIDGDLREVEHAVFRVRPRVLHLVTSIDAPALSREPSLWSEDVGAGLDAHHDDTDEETA